MANKLIQYSKLSQRQDYSKFSTDFFNEPDLLDSIRNSYDEKLLMKELDQLFKLYFPIKHDKNTKYIVHYYGILPLVKHKKFVNEEDAREKGLSYEKSLYIDIRLENTKTGEINGVKKNKNGISDGVFFGNLPCLTKRSTFIINGVEKNIVGQIVRAPGLYFIPKSKFKVFNKKTPTGVCELYPGRGSMLNFFIKNKTIKIAIANSIRNKAEVFTATELLKAFGMSEDNIKSIFTNNEYIKNSLLPFDNKGKNDSDNDKFTRSNIFEDKMIRAFLSELQSKKAQPEKGLFTTIRKLLLAYDAIDNKDSAKAVQVLDQIVTEWTARYFIESLGIPTRSIENSNDKTSFQEIFTNFFMTQRNYDILTSGRYKLNRKLRLTERLNNKVLASDIGKLHAGQFIEKNELDILRDTFASNKNIGSVSFELTSPNKIIAKQDNKLDIVKIYFNNVKHDKIIELIAPAQESDSRTLNLSDFISIISFACETQINTVAYDDIEHLGNKRIKLINEQFRNKLNIGLAKVEKTVKDKLSSLWVPTAKDEQATKIEEKATIKNIVNTKHFQHAIRSFFNTYELTNFLDQENPLSELSAKRKISAMGNGGISRDDKNIQVRDIHQTHYGRICPIEAPEGQNVGLIMALSAYAKIDENGFISSPYRIVENGVITDKVEYLTALKEDEHVVADSSIPFDPKTGKIKVKSFICRYLQTQQMKDVENSEYVDLSPRQITSASASLIPFLETDEAHRGEMASNMQRQAVPLLKPHAPSVGTGFEHKIAKDSCLGVSAEEDGKVTYVDSTCIEVGNKKYPLIKFTKSNQNTCISQQPFVSVGQSVKAGEMIADGPAMNNGEIALGQNLNVAFISWNGFNYEDAIVVSDRLIKDDLLSSITLNEITFKVMKTLNGDEEVTRNIVNVTESQKAFLDKDGIVRVGTEVKEGNILVGKITPRGKDKEISPEEKFLSQLFGEKTTMYKDKSLRLPYGEEGIVYKVQRIPATENENFDKSIIEIIKIYIAQKRKIQVGDKLAGRHGNKGVISIVVPQEDMPHYEDGTPIDICLNPAGVPSRMNIGQILETHLGLALRKHAINSLYKLAEDSDYDAASALYGISHVLSKNLLSTTKEYIKDSKIKSLNAFDLSIILAKVGMIVEDLNVKVSTPSFNGANIQDIADLFKEVGLDIKENGKSTLIDGRTGEKFSSPITTGTIYMLKLDHMVEDKIHARDVGSYSKITQQPLGGKSQNGGQRLGEMEVWSLEAYGAAYNLREMLTLKSDDLYGRNLAYRNIIYNKEIPTPSFPDAFKYMTKLLQGLCLQVNVLQNDGAVEDINSFSSTELRDNFDKSEMMSSSESCYGEGEITE
ncbi:MAG: DNA-directed RNA polymerase subunit beta [Mycoplasmoidaceae bacterium]|nr:MAG: DNA-directed RNA polymerase subunit beta [Mycoplasmoidaceae bacterium]